MNIRAERLYPLMQAVCAAVAPALELLAAKHERQYGASPIYESLVRIAGDGVKLIRRIAESGGNSNGRTTPV